MTPSPAQVIQTLLANPLDLAIVKSVTTPDVTYVSLSEDNPELKRYLPWTGTNRGPESIVRAFEGIGRAWETKAFEVREGRGTGRQGRDVRHVHLTRAGVGPGDHVALLTAGEGQGGTNSLPPISRGHLRYLRHPRPSPSRPRTGNGAH